LPRVEEPATPPAPSSFRVPVPCFFTISRNPVNGAASRPTAASCAQAMGPHCPCRLLGRSKGPPCRGTAGAPLSTPAGQCGRRYDLAPLLSFARTNLVPTVVVAEAHQRALSTH